MYFGNNVLLEASGTDSKLKVIYIHMLKYECQPEKQDTSWLRSMFIQRQAVSNQIKSKGDLNDLLASNDKLFKQSITKAEEETLYSVIIKPHDISIYDLYFVLKNGNLENFCKQYYNAYNREFNLEEIDYYGKYYGYKDNQILFGKYGRR